MSPGTRLCAMLGLDPKDIYLMDLTIKAAEEGVMVVRAYGYVRDDDGQFVVRSGDILREMKMYQYHVRSRRPKPGWQKCARMASRAWGRNYLRWGRDLFATGEAIVQIREVAPVDGWRCYEPIEGSMACTINGQPVSQSAFDAMVARVNHQEGRA